MDNIDNKLNQLATDVAVIKTKLELLEKRFPCQAHDNTINDHETRLRGLEDFKAKVIGALIFGSTLGGMIGGVIVVIISKLF